jgi:hypothetical protein
LSDRYFRSASQMAGSRSTRPTTCSMTVASASGGNVSAAAQYRCGGVQVDTGVPGVLVERAPEDAVVFARIDVGPSFRILLVADGHGQTRIVDPGDLPPHGIDAPMAHVTVFLDTTAAIRRFATSHRLPSTVRHIFLTRLCLSYETDGDARRRAAGARPWRRVGVLVRADAVGRVRATHGEPDGPEQVPGDGQVDTQTSYPTPSAAGFPATPRTLTLTTGRSPPSGDGYPVSLAAAAWMRVGVDADHRGLLYPVIAGPGAGGAVVG